MTKLDHAQISFAACVMVNMVDVMGVFFTAPVIVPYGQQIGASTAEIASFSTIRFGLSMVSLLWMPKLADARGTKLTMLISVIGTAIAYGIQGNSHLLSGCEREGHVLAGGEELQLWPGHNCVIMGGGPNITIFNGNSTHPAAVRATGFGGAVECEADCGNKNGVYFMLLGRAIAGFFGGTQPILRAYVAAISLPNMAVLKVRTTVLFASMQAGNFAMAPIAGVISRFGLHLPWYVATVATVFCMVFVSAFFKNASEVNERKKPAKDAEAAKAPAPPPLEEEQPPTRDRVLWTMLLSYFCIFQAVAGIMLLLPLLLEYDDFGFNDPTSVEKSRENLASATSLAMVPNGVTNLLMSTVGFLIVSSRIGDRATMRIGGALAGLLLCLYGFASKQYWHLLMLHGGSGIGIGLMVPALGPTLARYNGMAHAKTSSVASALPMLGMQIGQVVGPLVFGLILGNEQDRTRMNLAWLVAGISFIMGLLLADLGFTMITRHPVMKRLTMTPEQLKVMLETNAKDEEEFVEDMVKLLRGMLTKGDPEYRGLRLWSGVAQRFVARVISNSIPKVRDEPEEHLEDIADWVLKVGNDDDIEYLAGRFPQLRKRLRLEEESEFIAGDSLLRARRPSSISAGSTPTAELHWAAYPSEGQVSQPAAQAETPSSPA